MPTYDYRCRDCGHEFEAVQAFSDDALTEDPETGVPVERVLHPVAIHFKGKGFHNTDYGTRRRNRELEKSAKEGADSHDAKTAEKAKEKKEAKAKGSGKEKPASSKKKD